MSISRRRLIGAGAAAVMTGTGQSAPVQTRSLGATGARVPIVAMGCGESWWRACGTEDKAAPVLSLALDSGIRYLDTGQSYGKGTSETWIGNALGRRRGEVFISTKISTRDGAEALRETERGLQRLRTDHVDLIHIHNLQEEEDLARIESKGGLLDVLRRLREQKMARFIGITSHRNPAILRTAIERHDFDCVQMALNAAMQGHYDGASSRPGNSFEEIVLPAARKKNMGVIAMKVTGRGQLAGAQRATGAELIRYALSLPIAVAVVGMGDEAHVRENAALARTFQPMAPGEMKRLASRMTPHKAALDRYFHSHLDS